MSEQAQVVYRYMTRSNLIVHLEEGLQSYPMRSRRHWRAGWCPSLSNWIVCTRWKANIYRWIWQALFASLGIGQTYVWHVSAMKRSPGNIDHDILSTVPAGGRHVWRVPAVIRSSGNVNDGMPTGSVYDSA